ncbi:hypothetical protein Aph01nite_17620 [Acrocarpospora phusangensis]|uniref:Signal peptidase I n=2 Tax=Acrocarpospora phusangensis TaxID=1070424 RepID=A0A919Q6Y7_9ACTN|nr:hypothetical protein Aph01nite_17620 [Acrocarpospora phusangensis]
MAGRKGYTVPSKAMEPTIMAGRHIMAVLPDDDYAPELGDVVFFRAPESWEMNGVYVSRVIGVPGAAIQCCDDQGRIVLNGRPLEESYIKEPPASRETFGPLTVPAGRVWVQGDNRHMALDSRHHQGADPTIPVSNIVGVADLSTVK